MESSLEEDRFRSKVVRYTRSLALATNDRRRSRLIELLAREAAKAKLEGWTRLHP